MEFLNSEFLIALIIPFILLFLSIKNKDSFERYFNKEILKLMEEKGSGLSKRVRVVLLNIALIFAIIALARPIVNRGEIKVKEEFRDIVVAFDISKSMFATDLYPNRLEFSRRKFFNLLDELKDSRFGVIAFSSRAFLVSPITSDFYTLRYLVKNLDVSYISLKGTNILEPLKVTNEMLKDKKQKILVIFTDGGDKKDYKEEIEYAKANNIALFILGVATSKGSVIKDKNGVLKDRDGNIVVTKLNEAIANLAIESGGAFVKYSLNNEDIKTLASLIKQKFKAKASKDITIKDKKELFYYPLLIAIVLFLVAISSLPRRKK